MKKKLLIILGLLVLTTVVLVMPVAADGTSTITGNPAAVIDLVVTGNFTDWNLQVGDNFRQGAGTDPGPKLNVSSTSTQWRVTALDNRDDSKPASTDGKMADWDTAGTPAYNTTGVPLATALAITGETVDGDVTGSAISLTNTGQTIEAGHIAVLNQVLYPQLNQQVLYTDQTLLGTHVYRIVVTFNAYVV